MLATALWPPADDVVMDWLIYLDTRPPVCRPTGLLGGLGKGTTMSTLRETLTHAGPIIPRHPPPYAPSDPRCQKLLPAGVAIINSSELGPCVGHPAM